MLDDSLRQDSRLPSPANGSLSTSRPSPSPGPSHSRSALSLKISSVKFLLRHPADSPPPSADLLDSSPPDADDAPSITSPSDDHSDSPYTMPGASRRSSRRSSSRSSLPIPAAPEPSTSTSRTRRGGSKAPTPHDSFSAADDAGYTSSHSQTRSTRQHPVAEAAIAEEANAEAGGSSVAMDANGSTDTLEGGGAGRRSLRGRKPPRVIDSEDEDHEAALKVEDNVDAPPRKRGRPPKVRPPPIQPHISDEDDEDDRPQEIVETVSLHGRRILRPVHYASADDSEEEAAKTRPSRLSRGVRKTEGFVVEDEEYDQEDGGYGERKRSTRMQEKHSREAQANKEHDRARRAERRGSGLTKPSEPKARATRNSTKHDASYEQDGDGSVHEETQSDTDDEDLDLNDEDEDEDGVAAPRRALRQKSKINYYTLPPLEAPPEKGKNKKGKYRSDNPFGGLPANLTGAQWAELYPDKAAQGQDSDSDDDRPNFSTPRKAALFSSNAAAAAAGFGGAGGMFAGGAAMDLAGTPNNLGKVGGAALADTDPLGVDPSVSFESVGGLGAHIQQLKEMVSLPLLYPEVFERFNITPPRGVLFHGPPGTGKTLLARALAASCSTEGRKISFFMRKGADCLSKWVGEAERQLRLLFEEAKKCQPSIIFFDEIDGLAPVRSSKQEQIHASIVSTLLALMDGMDGRGQVIVIGATNRPDAIDPALRRPGRFDREFYFPLPNLEGRRKILDIHTSGWNPPIEETFKDELALLTKGYGGADLRALCTEAALNAVQRTYPQIYKTNDRLVIKPETIDVTARDFIISQKNLIPSSARATSSAAAQLPPQLEPLLAEALKAAEIALTKVLPDVKKANILEEAEWEDEGGGFEKEKMMQAFETLRVFRPRMIIHGDPGMGQGYVGAAVLHHLEGYHVQTLDLATLVSDSSRTMEAACVQLFIEAKRHKPSILFVPSLVTWCQSVTDTVRSTIKGLLDGLDPSDPILLLAIVDGPLGDVPSDVRSWFGFVKGNRVHLTAPRLQQREAFFADVLLGIQRPPNEYPDAMPRRKRVLEKLAIAPPPPPRAPTAAEIQQLELNDQRLMEYLKWKLGPLLNELKKRYKRFTRSLYDDWRTDDLAWRREQLESQEPVTGLGEQPYHNVDLDSMHMDLYNGIYHTPDDFLADILRIQGNAEVNAHLENDSEAPVKAGQMVNHSKVMLDQTFDNAFRADCARMAERMAEREKNAPEAAASKARKGKGKAIVLDASAIAAVAAAGGGGRYGTRSRQPAGRREHKVPVELEDPTEIERRLKRNRKEGEDSQASGDDHGPSKRAKANGVNGDGHEMDVDGEGEDDVPEGEGENGVEVAPTVVDSPEADDAQPVASTSQLNGGTPSFANLLNPGPLLEAPVPDLIPGPPKIPGASTSHQVPGDFAMFSLAPPMQVGALPEIDDMEFSGPLKELPDVSTLLPLPPSGPSSLPLAVQVGLFSTNADDPFASMSSLAPLAPLAPQSSSVRFSDDVQVGTSASATRQASPATSEPIAIDPPTPEPNLDFVLSGERLDALAAFLRDETDGLNVDQLEQLRAACYDIIWRGRKAWDRESMLEELVELARDFVAEVHDSGV